MFLITVILKLSPHVLQFHFDKYADAEKVLNRYNSQFSNKQFPEVANSVLLSIDDNYGSKSSIHTHDIAGVFVTDLAREMSAHEVVEVEKHKKDARVMKQVQSGIVAPRNVLSN